MAQTAYNMTMNGKIFSQRYMAGPRFGGAEEGEVQHHPMYTCDTWLSLTYLVEGIDARTFVRTYVRTYVRFS